MPELPEVETVCKNLDQIIQPKSMPAKKILAWKFWRKDLRFALPIKDLEKLKSEKFCQIFRRAKYIVFEFENSLMISHLGMTGSWSTYFGDLHFYPKQKHDHVAFEFFKDQWLVYNDPRRFGFIHHVESKNKTKYFINYGLEPIDITVDLNSINCALKKLNTNIKSALMNQKYVVGVGNIYACEALFRAKIFPLKKCSKLKDAEYRKLWVEVRAVLNEAILAGGSTIKDYKNANNEAGSFQKKFFVYGRDNENCVHCRAKILKIVISGRATFYCKHCQN